MLYIPQSTLETKLVHRGKNAQFHCKIDEGSWIALSLRCVFNGRAQYIVEGATYLVDDSNYLIFDSKPYEMNINSNTEVETFCLRIPESWKSEAIRCLVTPADQLIDDPMGNHEPRVEFLDKLCPHDTYVTPYILSIRNALLQGRVEDAWLEEQIRGLVVGMLQVQRDIYVEVANVPAVRNATRVELYKRLNRAKDYINACLNERLTLKEMAAVSALSPHHFLRTFTKMFGVTPHTYLTQKRLERAQWLLMRTMQPITTICFEVGFESPGSFSTLFKRHLNMSPRAFRQKFAEP